MSLREFLQKKTQAIYDVEFYNSLQEVPFGEWMSKPNPLSCRGEYLEKIEDGIHKSKLNSLKGLKRFSRKDLICGTTQSFDEAYFRYRNKRLRIFKGEYAYHLRVNPNLVFIEDAPLREGDYVITSLPFCSTGDIHPSLGKVLMESEALGIPVEVDCAYFGTCEGIQFDFDHPSIKAVSFSLSKGMGLGDIRSGIRFSDYDDNLPIAQQNNYNHTVLLAAKVGIFMLDRFDFDYIPRRYGESQKSVCEELNLTPTKCMHLALGNEEDYSEFIVDDLYYRVGLREVVKMRFQGKV